MGVEADGINGSINTGELMVGAKTLGSHRPDGPRIERSARLSPVMIV